MSLLRVETVLHSVSNPTLAPQSPLKVEICIQIDHKNSLRAFSLPQTSTTQPPTSIEEKVDLKIFILLTSAQLSRHEVISS